MGQEDLESVTETGQDVFNTASSTADTTNTNENIPVIKERDVQEEESEHKEETDQGNHITTNDKYSIKSNNHDANYASTTYRPKNMSTKKKIKDEIPAMKNQTEPI